LALTATASAPRDASARLPETAEKRLATASVMTNQCVAGIVVSG